MHLSLLKVVRDPNAWVQEFLVPMETQSIRYTGFPVVQGAIVVVVVAGAFVIGGSVVNSVHRGEPIHIGGEPCFEQRREVHWMMEAC
jgi:hypothetical protein